LVIDFWDIGGLVMRMVVVIVLPVPSGSEKTGNGRTTRTRNTTDSRGGLGDVEERVVTLEHERMVVVTEKEVLARRWLRRCRDWTVTVLALALF